MKTIVKCFAIVAVLVLISTGSLFAQKSGVFKTYADYTTGKMEYGINCATEKHKIKLNDFLGKDFITVVHDGKPYNLKKAETWGFQLCDEKVVRFSGKEHFPLLEKHVLWIYTKESIQQASSHAGGAKYVTKYYFSKGGDGAITDLTLNNVKAAFPENHKLHDAISEQFKTDASLGEMDTYHKMANINHLLEMQGLK